MNEEGLLVFQGQRKKPFEGPSLQLLHSSNVGALDVVLEAVDLLLQLVERDLLVLDHQVDHQLLDTETDGHELGETPDETVLLDATDGFLERLHVRLVVCRGTGAVSG